MKEGGKVRCSLYLLLAAVIWGLAFVSQSKGMDYMGPLTFNGVRSLIGAGALALYLLAARRGKKVEWPESRGRMTLLGGICCGLTLTASSTAQQIGIQYTTVGKAGFITTLYIVFVPIAGLFFRRRVSRLVWTGAFLAVAGMYLMCMTESLSLGRGDLLVLLCAALFSGHILLVDYFSPQADGVAISCIQVAVCGGISTAGALLLEHPSWGQLWAGMMPLLYAGVISCGVAYTLQILGQRDVNPTVAALLLSLESVFAAFAGWAAYQVGFLKTDQTMTGRQILGCALVFVAVILAQLPEGKRKK